MVKQLQLLNALSPMDVIVAKKRKGLGRILDHYIIYLGNNEFIGNLEKGVKFLSVSELQTLLMDYEPVKIRKFNGNSSEVFYARQRALSKLGSIYSLLGFNCEHFANWVQYGKETSKQVQNVAFIGFGLLALNLIFRGNGNR